MNEMNLLFWGDVLMFLLEATSAGDGNYLVVVGMNISKIHFFGSLHNSDLDVAALDFIMILDPKPTRFLADFGLNPVSI